MLLTQFPASPERLSHETLFAHDSCWLLQPGQEESHLPRTYYNPDRKSYKESLMERDCHRSETLKMNTAGWAVRPGVCKALETGRVPEHNDTSISYPRETVTYA